MKKLRAAIEGKPNWETLMQIVELVESNRESNPNAALDGAKSLVETIAKTILSDKGITYGADPSFGYLVKLAFKNLPIFAEMETRDKESTCKILNAISTTCVGLGEFRNHYGFFSHGNDVHALKFDRYLVELVIGAADLLASFLITAHEEDHRDRTRLHYEDYPEFNGWLDEQYGVEVKDIPISASMALFSCDIVAYRAQLIEFWNTKEDLIRKLENSGSFKGTHEYVAALNEYLSFFTQDEITKMVQAKSANTQIAWIQSDEAIADFYSAIEPL